MTTIYSVRVQPLHRFLIELAGSLRSQRGVERMSCQGVKSIGIPRKRGFDVDLRGDGGRDQIVSEKNDARQVFGCVAGRY